MGYQKLLAAILTALGLCLNDFGAMWALPLEGILEDGCYGNIRQLADFSMPEGVVADWINASDIAQLGQEFTCLMAAFQVSFFIGDEKENRSKIFLCHAGLQLLDRCLFLLVSAALGLYCFGVEGATGKGGLTADHHRSPLFFTRQHHVAKRGPLPVLFFNMLPAVLEEQAVVVQTDKKDITAPAQPIANMKGRSGATTQTGMAMGAEMFFFGILETGIRGHRGFLWKSDDNG